MNGQMMHMCSAHHRQELLHLFLALLSCLAHLEDHFARSWPMESWMFPKSSPSAIWLPELDTVLQCPLAQEL